MINFILEFENSFIWFCFYFYFIFFCLISFCFNFILLHFVWFYFGFIFCSRICVWHRKLLCGLGKCQLGRARTQICLALPLLFSLPLSLSISLPYLTHLQLSLAKRRVSYALCVITNAPSALGQSSCFPPLSPSLFYYLFLSHSVLIIFSAVSLLAVGTCNMLAAQQQQQQRDVL